MRTVFKLIVATAALFASSGAAQAADRILAKPGITLAIRDADDAACWKAVKGQKGEDENAVWSPPANVVTYNSQFSPAGNVIAAGVGGLLADMAAVEAAQRVNHLKCMRANGYVYARLSRKEQSAYDFMQDAQRRIWEDAFLRSDRVAEATRRLVPELPTDPVRPVFSIVPGSATLAEGPVKVDDAAVTARAVVRTARLTTAISYDGGRATVAAGEIFLQTAGVVITTVPTKGSPQYSLEPAWCAAAMTPKAKVKKQVLCLVDVNDGYQVILVAPTASGVFEIPFLVVPPRDLLTAPVELVPLSGAESEPVEVRYILRRAPIIGEVVTGYATVNDVTYLVPRICNGAPQQGFERGKGGVIEVTVGEETVRLTSTGSGKARTYAAARQEP